MTPPLAEAEHFRDAVRGALEKERQLDVVAFVASDPAAIRTYFAATAKAWSLNQQQALRNIGRIAQASLVDAFVTSQQRALQSVVESLRSAVETAIPRFDVELSTPFIAAFSQPPFPDIKIRQLTGLFKRFAEEAGKIRVEADVKGPLLRQRITAEAYRRLTELLDPARLVEAEKILGDFCRVLAELDVEGLPALRAAQADDGSVLVEWIFSDRRLGFSLDTNPKDSGWYFVLARGSSERFEAGSLDQFDVGRLVKIALKA